MILIIDNYDSFTYNLVHYLQEEGAEVEVARNDTLTYEEALNKGAKGIVLSPGPCTPNEAGISMDVAKHADVPVLGVCLGHQSIGQVFGGIVESSKDIMHGKISTVTQTSGDLFKDVPEKFDVVRYHSLSVRRDGLPEELRVDADTPDGEIMAMSHVTRPIYGLQFHPESIRSEHGKTMLRNFLKITGEV